MQLTDQQYSNLLDDLDDGKHQYSFFRRYIEALHPSPRVLIQMKCIEKFKWKLNKETDSKMDWDEAIKLWSSSGYAKAFQEVYDRVDTSSCCLEVYREVCILVDG